MANKIRKLPFTKSKGFFCSISEEVAMMVSAVSRAVRASSAMLGTAS